MQKKTKFKLQIRDVLIVFLCISACAFFLYLFWRDINSYTADRSDKKSVGTIFFKEKIAQRKFDDRVVWERVPQNATLYDADTIRTADFARASIKFNDGTVLELFENTMIQVHYSDEGGLSLDIGGGDIQVDSSSSEKSVNLKMSDGTQVNVEKGATLAAKSDGEGGNIEVLGGSATVTAENGETASLSNGQSISVDSEGISKNAITVLYPPKELRLLADGVSAPVRFEWKREENGDEPVVLQLSRTRDGKNPFFTKEFSNETNASKIDADGIFYWRVFLGGDENRVSSGRIEVTAQEKTKIITPRNESVFLFKDELPRVVLRWSKSDFADHYKIELSSSEDMKSTILEKRIEDESISFDNLDEGTYFWRVTPYFSLGGKGYSFSSEIASFKIQKSETDFPPMLSVPVENAKVRRNEKSLQTAFMWKNEKKESKYILAISSDSRLAQAENFSGNGRQTLDLPNGEQIDAMLFESETERVPVLLSYFQIGKYYWKVARFSKIQDDAPLSETRSFEILPPETAEMRLLYPPNDFGVEKQMLSSVGFLWKSEGLVSVQFSKTKDFSSVEKEIESNETTISSVELAEGEWWWRVKSERGTTEARKFYCLGELVPPQFLYPQNDEKIVRDKNDSITFAWKSGKESNRNLLSVFDANGNTVFQGSISESKKTLDLKDGEFSAKIQSFSDGDDLKAGRTSAVSSINFRVHSAERISLSSPKNGDKIKGLSALRNPLSFSWKIGADKAENQEFVLWRVQKNGSLAEVERKKVGSPVRLTRLPSAHYVWKVFAKTQNNVPLDSEENSFEIEEIEPLSKAEFVFPKDGDILDEQFFRNSRQIVLSWKKVVGATNYSFSLSKKEGKKSKVIRSEKNMKGNSVALKDLASLENGEYEWTVTAFSIASDGFEENRSETAKGAFEIRVGSPTKVEGVQPGRMYGE